MNSGQGLSRQTFFADQNSSGQHDSLLYGDYQRPQPVSLSAPSRGTFSAALSTSHARQPSGPVQQSRRLIDRAEASTVPSMFNNGDIMPFGTDLGAPLQTHISLDSLLSVPMPNSQQESFGHKHGWAEAQQFPAARRLLPLEDRGTHVALNSRKRGSADVARQQNEGGAAGDPARQPVQTHKRTVQALQRLQAGSYDEVGLNDDSAHPDCSTTQSAIPSQMEDFFAAAGVQSGTVQIQTRRNMVPHSTVVTASKQVQAKAGTKQAAGKVRAVASTGRAVAEQPQQGQVEGQSGRAAARALRQSGSFASPTRSSTAKAAGKDNARGSRAVKPPAATYQLQRKLTGQAVRPDRHAVATTVATAAPLMTTFR